MVMMHFNRNTLHWLWQFEGVMSGQQELGPRSVWTGINGQYASRRAVHGTIGMKATWR